MFIVYRVIVLDRLFSFSGYVSVILGPASGE